MRRWVRPFTIRWALPALFLCSPVFAQPTITAISLTSANVGASVTVTGTNFSATAGNNTVFFGATKATVTAASTTSLTVTVPTGATSGPISVTVANLTAFSTQFFLPTFAGTGPTIDVSNLAAKVDFTAGTNPRGGAVGDVDGDGKPDLVVVNYGSNTVSVYRNTSTSGVINAGSFTAKVDFTTGTNPFSVAMGDVDGDGKPDLAVANYGSNTVSVYRNTSTSGTIDGSSLAAKVDFTTGTGPIGVAIGDVDGDGKPDLAVANYDANTLSVYRNTSTSGTINAGSFAAKVDFTTGTNPRGVAVGDVDGDGKADLTVANFTSNTVSVFRNTSTSGTIDGSSLAAKVDFTTGTNPRGVAIGDADGDGKLDLAVANDGSSTVSVFRNTSTSGTIDGSSLAAKVDFTTGTAPFSVAMGDVDGDGKPELAVTNYTSNTLSVFRNTSTSGTIDGSSFAAKVDFTAGTNPWSVVVGDVDGDGKPDLTVTNDGSAIMSVFRNQTLTAPLPTITSFTPTSAAAGASVTITGTNFSATAGNNTVFFGAVKATVTAASTTSLTVTVPTGATFGPISVRVGDRTAISKQFFLPTFAGTDYHISSSTLAAKVDFTTRSGPYGVAIGDVDGDGKPDLVVANQAVGSSSVSVYRNTSTSGAVDASSFAAKVDFTTGDQPRSVAIGDVDGDGKPDLVVANSAVGTNTVSVLRNTSTSGTIDASSFAAKVDYTTAAGASSVGIGDLDGDGKLDLAVAANGADKVSVFRNTSISGTIDASSFAAKVDFTTGNGPRRVVIGDVDGDGKPDLSVTNFTSNTMSVFRNTSVSGTIDASSFAAKVDFTTGTGPLDVAVGDVDGDGKLDLSVANWGSASSGTTVSVFRNTSTSGTISLAAKVDYTTGSGPRSVAIGDVDGDGNPDLAVANDASNTVSVFRNTSTSGTIDASSFAAKVDFTTGSSPYIVAIGDVDGDGKPDLVVANNVGAQVSVLRNQALTTPLPTITSFTPTSAAVGASVTITGTNFSATAGNNTVYFGATKATVTAASTTSLTVTVPTGATFGPLSVMVANRTAISKQFFLPTFAGTGSTIDASNLAAKVDFTAGTGAQDVVIGDVDGDDKPDLIVTNEGGGSGTTVSVFRNTSSSGTINSSSLAAKVDFTTGTGPHGVAMGDVDGDGKPDIAVANYGSGGSGTTVSVFRNTSTSGTVSFAAKVDFTTGSGPLSVALGDLDGDGKPDLVVTNYGAGSGNTVSVFRNTSTSGVIDASSFAAKVDFTTGTGPQKVAIGDVDGDSKSDLAVTNETATTVSVFRNTSTSGVIGASSFAAKVDFTTGTGPVGVAMGDGDGDGKLDLIVTNYNAATVSVFRNTSTSGTINASSFAAKVDFTTGTNPYGVSMGDVDGDGKPDLAVVNNASSTVSVFRNTATSGTINASSLAAKMDFTTGTSPEQMAIGDLDGDGKPDLAVANGAANTVSVLRNQTLTTPLPTITSFTPTSAAPGASVTITGTNFSTTAGNNTVFFDPVKATVTSASSTSLTVTVPNGAGYGPISVTVGNRTAISKQFFLPTFAATVPGVDPTSLAAKVDFTTGTGPRDVTVGDVDGDGKPDLVVANNTSNTVSVFRNTSTSGAISTGSFAAKVDFTTGTSPYSVAMGDVDGDGKPDVVAANTSSNTVSVFRNTSTSGTIDAGSFAAKVDFTAGSGPQAVAIGDVDGDGKPDLAVINGTSNTVSVYRNTSTSGTIDAGSFAAKVDFTTGTGPHSIAIGDVDGDGKPDLAVTNNTSNTVSVFRNTATSGVINTSSFAAKVDFTAGTSPVGVVVGDVDGDGKLELAVANLSSNTVSVFRNTSTSGTISFAAKVDFTTGTGPLGVAMGDVDGDGKPDLAVANYAGGGSGTTVSMFRNTSMSGTINSSSLAAKVDFTTGTDPHRVVIGDIDGDGKPDLAVANYNSASVSVFHNQTLTAPLPTITSFTPTSAAPGASVTITGTNFSATAGNNTVFFGATKATVTAASTTSLTVTVPTGATYNPISVTVSSRMAISKTFFLPTFASTVPGVDVASLATKVDFTTGDNPQSVAIVDVDGDGKPDITAVNANSNSVSVFRNTSTSGFFLSCQDIFGLSSKHESGRLFQDLGRGGLGSMVC